MFSQKHMKASTVGAANGNFIAAGGASACCGGATTYSTAAPQIFCSFTIMLSATQHGMTLPPRLGRAGTQACRHALLRPYMIVRPIAFGKPIVTVFGRAVAHHLSRNDNAVHFLADPILAVFMSNEARNTATLFVATAPVDTTNESNGTHDDDRLKVH